MSAELQRHPEPGLSSGARTGSPPGPFPLQDPGPLAGEIKGDRERWAEDSQSPSHSQAALGLPSRRTRPCCTMPSTSCLYATSGHPR